MDLGTLERQRRGLDRGVEGAARDGTRRPLRHIVQDISTQSLLSYPEMNLRRTSPGESPMWREPRSARGAKQDPEHQGAESPHETERPTRRECESRPPERVNRGGRPRAHGEGDLDQHRHLVRR